METLIIAGSLGAIWYIYNKIASASRITRYIKSLKIVSDEMDNEEYQNSSIYNLRILKINEMGLPKAIDQLIKESRMQAIEMYNMKSHDFTEMITKNAENDYIMRYIIAHNLNDEFQNMMKLSNELMNINQERHSYKHSF